MHLQHTIHAQNEEHESMRHWDNKVRFLRSLECSGSCRQFIVIGRILHTLEWPYSSPMRIMGVPWDSSSAAARLRICRARSRRTLGFRVSPSTPQFQLRLWFSPSLLPYHRSILSVPMHSCSTKKSKSPRQMLLHGIHEAHDTNGQG